jgi:phosphoglycolate phosphatase
MSGARSPTGVRAVLFDLDGTLADTAPDLAYAVNAQRHARGLAPLPLEQLRPLVSQGARGMLRGAFGLTPEHADYAEMREEFLAVYAGNLCLETRLFDGMAQVLDAIESTGMRWGVVTNKLARFSEPLLEAMGLAARSACVVSGDTCARAKPHPDPLLEAARRLDLPPQACMYVGDDERDIQAGHAAAMLPVAALYGYLGDGNPPSAWGAAHHIEHPLDLLNLLPLSPPVG